MRLLFTGGGGAGNEAIHRLLKDRYDLHFADACASAFSPTLPMDKCHEIPLARDPRFAERIGGIYIASNTFGTAGTEAAYSPDGAAWVDALMEYLAGNKAVFDAAIADIPGLRSMPLQSTYLSWVDFVGTGMDRAEFTRRVEQEAKIAANHGPTFGKGGESWLRFNIGTQRSRIEEASDRLRRAFADLQ